jgi:hypothetical protein
MLYACSSDTPVTCWVISDRSGVIGRIADVSARGWGGEGEDAGHWGAQRYNAG